MKKISARLIIAILLSVVLTQCGVNDQSDIPYKKNDLIVFAGGTNISDMQYNGFLEAIIQASLPKKKLHFRNLAWDGDTVFEQFRDLNFGSWGENIDSLGADIVFVQFGQMESLRGEAGIDSFERSYRRLLDQIETKERKIVLLSPVPFEPEKVEQVTAYGLKNPLDNAVLEKYVASVQQLAQEKGYQYIDLFNPLKKGAASHPSGETHAGNGSSYADGNHPGNGSSYSGETHPGKGSSYSDGNHPNSESPNPNGNHSGSESLNPNGNLSDNGSLTSNGIHLTEEGHKQVAALVARAIGLESIYTSEMESLRKAIIAKNEIWFNYWRPGNWAFLKGDRTHVQFSRDWQDMEKRIFPEEMKEFQPLLESSEQRIYQLSAGLD